MYKSKKWARSVLIAFLSVFAFTFLFNLLPQTVPSPNLSQSGVVYAQGNDPDNEDKSCESTGEVLAWFACPVLKIIDGGAGFLSGQIEKLLTVSSDDYNDDSLKNSWQVMRNIALILLVPMMLFMVIGTALEFGPFDAYTVKKALPRMFIAVIFIVLSLPITQFFVNVSNVVGQGMEGIILSATGEPESLAAQYSASGGFLFSALVGAGALAGIATGAVTLGIVGSLALVTFVALLIGYVVLVVRQLLILVLMMIAPLAILVWIFPGNDKLWKIWRTTFIALLMMFPLIILLITSGKVFAGVIGDSQNQFTAFFIKTIAFIAPFFFIPATFKYGLGIFGNIAGMINDRSRGVFDRQRKYREGAKASARHQAQMGNRFAGGNDQNWRGSWNKRIGQGMTAPSAILATGAANPLKPSNYRKWSGAIKTATEDQAVNDVEGQMKENRTLPSWIFNDDLARIAAETENDAGTRQLLARRGYSGQGLEDAAQRIEASRRSMSNETFKILTTKQAIAGGTAYKDLSYIDADGNEVRDIDAGAAWAAAARAAGNNDAAAQYLVANGRSEALKAGRVDQGGAGFGTTIGAVDRMRAELQQNKTISLATIKRESDVIHKDVLDGQGAASLVHSSMKPSAVSQMAPTLVKSIVDTQTTAANATAEAPRLIEQIQQNTNLTVEQKQEQITKVTENVQNLEKRFTQNLASIGAVYDSLSVSSPNKARIVSEQVFSADIAVNKLSAKQSTDLKQAIDANTKDDVAPTSINILQAVDASRTNPEFLKMHREYGRTINDTNQRLDREAQLAADEAARQAAGYGEGPNPMPGAR